MSATKLTMDALADYQQAGAYKAQARATAQTGDVQARLMERDAVANDAIAMQNNRMQRRNAQSELAAVRSDNAVSNLISDGTGLEREMDMASRLEREINIRTDDALRQSSNMRNQAAYTRWDADLQASVLKRKAYGSKMSAIGNLVSASVELGKGAWDKWGVEGADTETTTKKGT